MGIIGTGIDLTHPDFRKSSINAFSLLGKDTRDPVGHETAVAWLLTRIAPGADFIVVKDRNSSFGFMSLLIDACEHLRQLGVQVINISSTTLEPTDGTDPASSEANYLAEHGVTVVAAAGNGGPRLQTVGAPGAAELAVTVGKVNSRDIVADKSARGPTLDGRLKPDCLAPGVSIAAAMSASLNQGLYGLVSCTSIAAPHVAGLAVLLKEAYPNATPDQLKQAIMESCDPVKVPYLNRFRSGNSKWATGSGRVNALHAYEKLREVGESKNSS